MKNSKKVEKDMTKDERERFHMLVMKHMTKEERERFEMFQRLGSQVEQIRNSLGGIVDSFLAIYKADYMRCLDRLADAGHFPDAATRKRWDREYQAMRNKLQQ
jgi:hypothetical protein